MQFRLRVEFSVRKQLHNIRLRAFGVEVEHLFGVLVGAVPFAVFKEHERTLQKRSDTSRSGVIINNGRLIDNGRFLVRFTDLLDTSDKVLHEAELVHILRLQVRELLGQIVGIHVAVRGNERFLRAVSDEHEKAAPLVLDPHCVEMLGLRAENDHHLCRVECGEYVRLVLLTELVFKRNAREKDLEALLCELVIQVGRNDGITGAPAVGACFLVTDEDVERLLVLRNSENSFLNFVDSSRLLLVNGSLVSVGVLERRLVILVHENRRKLRTVDGRHTLVCGGVFDVLDTVAAEHERPIRLTVCLVLFEDLFVHRHSLVKFVRPTEMVGAVIHIGAPVVVKLG